MYGKRLTYQEFESIVARMEHPERHQLDQFEQIVTGRLDGKPVIASYHSRTRDGWIFEDGRRRPFSPSACQWV